MSRNGWKDKTEVQNETTIKEWEDDTEEPLKWTDVGWRNSVVGLHSQRRTFSGDLGLNPTNAGPLGIMKSHSPKIAEHATIHDTRVWRTQRKHENQNFDKKLILNSSVNLIDCLLNEVAISIWLLGIDKSLSIDNYDVWPGIYSFWFKKCNIPTKPTNFVLKFSMFKW